MAIAAFNTFFYIPDAEDRKCGERTGLETQVVHTLNDGFSILADFSVWFLANALNTPPVTIQWQHEIQRNCTAIYTNRVRMWFNRYTASESYPTLTYYSCIII